jgi:hypothetical protein
MLFMYNIHLYGKAPSSSFTFDDLGINWTFPPFLALSFDRLGERYLWLHKVKHADEAETECKIQKIQE